MLKKFSFVLIIVLVSSAFLTGCYDSIEVDDQVYPILVGVDKGINNKIHVTVQYPTYSPNTGNNGPNGNSQGNGSINSVEAPGIIEACELLNMEVSRKVSLQHVKAFVFSQNIAEEGIGQYISSIQRYREIRSTVGIMVTKGSAEDFIKSNKSSIGTSISKMTELLLSQSQNNSYFSEQSFYEFYKNTLSNYEQPVATYAAVNDFHEIQKDGNNNDTSPLMPGKGFMPGNVPIESQHGRQLAGTALFDGDKMVGYLDTYETRYYLMVKGEFKSGIVTINDAKKSGYPIAIYLKLTRKPKIKAYFEDGKPIINVKLKMEADVESIHSRINYERISLVGDLNDQIKEFVLQGIINTVKKTQGKYNTDVFGFGTAVSKNFKTIQEWENYNWLKNYDKAKINVSLDLNIKKMGTKIGSTSIWNSKGRTGE